MSKKCAAAIVLLGFLILIGGCETVKGTFAGAANGMKRDWQALQGADAWMREILW